MSLLDKLRRQRCGWCRKLDTRDNLRAAAVTGNRQPIHSECLWDWHCGDTTRKHRDVRAL